MKLGLVGGSYQERSFPFDAQRTINMYPVMDETGQGKDVAALYSAPGKRLFCTAGLGGIRGEFSSANGRAFCVSGDGLYEISSLGIATLRGTLDTSTGNVSIDENATQLGVCDGEDLYILTYSGNAFAKVTHMDFPGAATVVYLDGYFIVNKPGTGEFYRSDIADGSAWDSLNFATAESSPDSLVRVFATSSLVLLGDRTTEFWYNNGDADLSFARMEGAKMEVGCAAAHSVVKMDNTFFWLGKTKDGQGIVYRASGNSPLRISTHAIEYKLQQIADLSDLRAYNYQEDGHEFYVLTGTGLETSLAYDVATKLWHERAKLETDGTYSTDSASSHMYAFGKHLVGDKSNGNIYEMSLDLYSDADNTLRRERIFTHTFNEGKPFRMNQLIVEFERGVGLVTGQGSDPVAVLQISEDGGLTWSPEYQASIGAIGNRNPRARWSRLGMAEISAQVTFKVFVTDPVKVAICAAYLT